MLIIEHTIETKASPKAIWSLWEDVKNWNTWDHGIEFSTLSGPFIKGTRGTLKPKGGPLVHTTLTLVEPLKMFINESKLFLCRIIVSHYLEVSHTMTKITHRIEMLGPLSFLFAYFIGKTMKKISLKRCKASLKKQKPYDKP